MLFAKYLGEKDIAELLMKPGCGAAAPVAGRIWLANGWLVEAGVAGAAAEEEKKEEKKEESEEEEDIDMSGGGLFGDDDDDW